MMTPTPPSTTSSSAGAQSPDAQFRVVRKRNRVPLSCAPCRHRKLKCNRSMPCENCVKRGDAASCSYASPSNRKKSQTSNTPDDMQNRIDRLEGLVLSLMTNGAQSAGPAAAQAALSASTSNGSPDGHLEIEGDDDGMVKDEMRDDESETEQVTKSFGVMKVDNNKSMYFGEAHWATILSDIAEVKNYFNAHKKQYEEQMIKVSASKRDEELSGPAIFFGATKPPTRAEIVSQIPSKYTTDILIARYFNSYDPATHILHGPTFHRQYAKHWQDPNSTSVAWIGQLFAMMRLAMYSYHRDGDEPPEFRGKALDMASTYRTLVAQCLILADYTKPINHMIETLVLHLHGEYTRSREAEVGVWVLVGMIARLAMRMGYHRDPKPFPNITPFQGEMRRRVWTFVRQADLLFSFQLSLPSMIRLGDSDTDLPRNIYDDEFDEDAQELPPSRPMNEATPVSYMISKARLAFGFGRVVEHINTVKTCTYEDLMKMDNNLREVEESLPDHLKFREMKDSVLDPAALIMQRFNLAILYHKAQCVLHRRHLARARGNPRYAHSRRQCLESSMELLRYQAILHQESSSNGRLRSLKWYINSLTSHDFLLAATIVCMDLYQGYQRCQTGQGQDEVFAWGGERGDELVKALEKSRDIWIELKDVSMDAYKASEMIGVMLTQLKNKSSQSLHAFPQSPANPFNPLPRNDGKLEQQDAAMTLGMMSGNVMAPNTFNNDPEMSMAANNPGLSVPVNQEPVSAPSPFSLFGPTAMMETPPANLDWEAWDSYIQSANFDPNSQFWPMPMDIPGTNAGDAQQSENPFPAGALDGGGTGPFMGINSPGNSSL